MGLCAAAWGATAVGAAGPRRLISPQIPVDPSRVSAASQRVDPNEADLASLVRLPGIGPTRARAILKYRQGRTGRAFVRADDLTAVPGIGPGTLDHLREHLDLPP